MKGRQILPLTVDHLPLLVEPCRTCLFWESTPARSSSPAADPIDVKRAWLSEVLQQWGSPGRIALVEGLPAGYVTYAPARLVPRATAFPTAPVSEDAVALLTARIAGDYAGQGLGRALVQRAAKDVLRHGIRAIEVFATTSSSQNTARAFRRRHRPDVLPRAARGGRHRRGAEPTASGEGGLQGTEMRSPVPSEGVSALAGDGCGDEHVERSPAHRHRPLSLQNSPVPKGRITENRSPEARRDDKVGVVSRGRSLGEPVMSRADDAADEEQDAADRAGSQGSPHGAAHFVPAAERPQHCLLPVQFLTAVGFYPVREHPLYPRLRLDLRTALGWSEELGLAVERLFTPVRAVAGRRPVGSVN